MSTVMHAYRIPRRRFWSFQQELRAWYLKHHPSALMYGDVETVAREYLASGKAVFGEECFKSLDALTKGEIKDFLTADLQFFYMEATVLFRVLERGHFFRDRFVAEDAEGNAFRKAGCPWEITPVFYDGRTDIPPLHERNWRVAERLDEMIRAKRYGIAPIVDADDLFNAHIDFHVKVAKRLDELKSESDTSVAVRTIREEESVA